MPKDSSIKSVLIIGSGPIVIGQAAEFDYAGTQACASQTGSSPDRMPARLDVHVTAHASHALMHAE